MVQGAWSSEAERQAEATPRPQLVTPVKPSREVSEHSGQDEMYEVTVGRWGVAEKKGSDWLVCP